LGFYPGVLFSKNIPPPQLEINTVIPYLKRYDGSWLDPIHKIPRQFDHSLSLEEWYEKETEALKVKFILLIFKYHKKKIPLS